MGSRKIIYKIKKNGQLNGQLVIEVGFDIKVTPSQAQVTRVFELLNEDGEGTGRTVNLSPDDFEIAR
ncbi:MAG TPA: hypothetical protein DDZ60_13805 [Planktothrix sp. UBA10369]|nr:hypothetical protein [Planktothrix sp. UBA10369]